MFLDRGIDFLGDLGQAIGGLGDLRGSAGLFRGSGTDLLRELVNFGHDVGNLFERKAQVLVEEQAFLNHRGALFHVFDSFARFLLNALDKFGNLLGGLRGFFRELADFFRDDGEAETMLASASGFDGGVESEKIGLLG